MRLSGVLLTTAPPGLTRAGRLNQCNFGYEVFSTENRQLLKLFELNSNSFSKKTKKCWKGLKKTLKT